jgi:cytochrome c oxidase subunit III
MTTYALRDERPAGWWGVLMLIAAEGMLFACLVATYFYLRFTSTAWPPDGIEKPRVIVPLVLVAILASTSVPMQLASLAAREGRIVATRLFLLLALFVQTGYLAYEISDFANQLSRFTPQSDAYGSIYYVLLGADHAHVALGLLFDVWLLGKLATGLTRYRVNAAQAIAWYWHAVNVLTIVVILTLVSARI